MYKLLDFGLARAYRQPTSAGSAGGAGDSNSADICATLLQLTADGAAPVGTPHYMAPEQWCTEKWGAVSQQSDLWAVGVLAFQLLTGELPFAPRATERGEIWQVVWARS
jgi:serine/threonine protein kinase